MADAVVVEAGNTGSIRYEEVGIGIDAELFEADSDGIPVRKEEGGRNLSWRLQSLPSD